MVQYNTVLAALESSSDNLLILSKAGGGKTSLLNKYLSHAKTKSILVVAPTGIAASHLNGSTIHSAFCLIPDSIPPVLSELSPRALMVLSQVKTLILDELSMIRADLLDSINKRLQEVRENELPFGGVRIILSGDFYQLPPVVKTEDKDALNNILPYSDDPEYHCFNADVFKDPRFFDSLKIFSLEHSFRHQWDPDFKLFLDRVRIGEVTESDLKQLRERLDPQSVIYPSLCTTRKEAIGTNFLNLKSQEKPIVEYLPSIECDTPEYLPFFSDHVAIDPISMAEGCSIIFIKNQPHAISGRYFNGTQGTITKIHLHERIPERVEIKTDTGNILTKVTPVRFTVTAPVYFEELNIIINKPIGTILNFPFLLAAGITIHRSQGLTISQATINIGRGGFAPGQLYVALSRVRKLKNLHLIQIIQEKDIFASEAVKDFMASIDKRIQRVYPS